MALEAVPGHWGGPPRTERLVFLEVGTDDHAEAEMDARALDVWFPAGVPRRGDHPLSVPGLRVGYLAFQTEKEPFARKPLRQAGGAAPRPPLAPPPPERAPGAPPAVFPARALGRGRGGPP